MSKTTISTSVKALWRTKAPKNDPSIPGGTITQEELLE